MLFWDKTRWQAVMSLDCCPSEFVYFLVQRGINHNHPLHRVGSTPSWKSLESAKMSREHLTAAWELHFITWPLCDCKCSYATVQLSYSAAVSAAQVKLVQSHPGASFAAIMCRNLDPFKLLASGCRSSKKQHWHQHHPTYFEVVLWNYISVLSQGWCRQSFFLDIIIIITLVVQLPSSSQSPGQTRSSSPVCLNQYWAFAHSILASGSSARAQ